MTNTALVIQLGAVFLSALMVFALVYVMTSLVNSRRGSSHDKVKVAMVFMAYVIISQLFWVFLYLAGYKMSGGIFASFYLVILLLVSLLLHRNYQMGLGKSLLYGAAFVLALFVAEMVAAFFLGILLLLADRGLSRIVGSLL